ncbi:MAG: ATP-binding protein [Planctomycetaceae bacterium]|nr:HAMP domain-containing protein [Planctomycetaceae bacterium]
MFSLRHFWRIFTGNMLLIVVCTVALSWTSMRAHREMILDRFDQGIEDASLSLTEYAREILLGQRIQEPGDRLEEMADRSFAEIHLFDVSGQVVATTQSEEDPARIALEPGLAFLQSATEPFRRSVTRPNGMRLEIHIRPIESAEGGLGYLQIDASRAELDSQLNYSARVTWGATLVVCLAGVLLSIYVAARITRPLEELTRASRAITIGNLYQTVPENSADEFGTLAQTFNSMSRELSTRINELQQQGYRLRENSERLATVLGGMVEGVIAVDSQERILFANDAAFRMIEFDGRRVIGRPYWEVLRNTDVQSVVRDVLAGQFQLKREIELPRSHNRISFIASRLPGEPCPGVVLVLHDVTELRRLEKIRSEFVSNVGHELKTPLAAIQACTDTLADGALSDQVHAEHFLKQISEHADRLHKLIIDLMELAKIESEEDVFHADLIDIGVPIQEAIDEHFSVARSHRIELVGQPTIEALTVLADPEGIRTIVNNLLDNAINYTPPGGRVCVAWYPEQGHVVIQISDTGIGIERKHLERIFERFYRVDAARARDAGGTGLGLAIVKHLCQHFSGTIGVASEPEQGTTFTIRFPLQPA